MLLRNALLVLALGAAPLAGAPQSVALDPWTDATARLEKAALEGSSRELRAMRDALRQRLDAQPRPANEAVLRYAMAYAAWRMASLPDVERAEKKTLLESAVTTLQQIVKADPRNAEAHALLGSIYGLQIAESPMVRGMTLGPRASAALDRAAEIDGNNPRVLLLQGVSAFNMPAMFGGGSDKAERLLRRSLERFAAVPAGTAWPNWGRFDAHAWLGQALLDKGDRAGARAEYDRARALAPNSGWLRYVLIPALDAAR